MSVPVPESAETMMGPESAEALTPWGTAETFDTYDATGARRRDAPRSG